MARTKDIIVSKERLKANEREFITSCLGLYKTYPEVVVEFQKNYGRRISKPTIERIYHDRSDEVEQLRSQYLKTVADIPIAIEKKRLERNEELYQLSQELGNKKEKIDYGIRCLREAREEIKGSHSTVNLTQFNQYNELSDDELIAKKKELEEKFKKTLVNYKDVKEATWRSPEQEKNT